MDDSSATRPRHLSYVLAVVARRLPVSPSIKILHTLDHAYSRIRHPYSLVHLPDILNHSQPRVSYPALYSLVRYLVSPAGVLGGIQFAAAEPRHSAQGSARSLWARNFVA